MRNLWDRNLIILNHREKCRKLPLIIFVPRIIYKILINAVIGIKEYIKKSLLHLKNSAPIYDNFSLTVITSHFHPIYFTTYNGKLHICRKSWLVAPGDRNKKWFIKFIVVVVVRTNAIAERFRRIIIILLEFVWQNRWVYRETVLKS